ncbi:MAG: hypothetical protein AB7N76_22930 [Planctomycetota bacterium]
MTRPRNLAGRLTRCGLGVSALALLLLAARPAEALYLFYMRHDLHHLISKEPAKIVGKQITVTDELGVLWPEIQQRKDQLKGQKYVLFDTTYFRCAVPTDKMGTHLEGIVADAKKGYEEVTKQIEEVNEKVRTRELSREQAAQEKRKLYWELYRIHENQPILTIYGTVERGDFWGDVVGKSDGVGTEVVTILVDKIEKPRKRWYKSLDE